MTKPKVVASCAIYRIEPRLSSLNINVQQMKNLILCHPRASSGQDPNQAIIVKCEVPQTIPNDHVLLEVDRFGFSANNVTYQALGEASHFRPVPFHNIRHLTYSHWHGHARYFEFHHTPEAEGVSSKTHGVTPVWGFGTIIKSTHPKVHPGERVYGYFAPARYLLLQVSPDVNKYAFFVPRPHLPPGDLVHQLTHESTD